MRKITLLFIVFFSFSASSFAQNNPVSGLNWSHTYTFMNNWFELSWQEPALPHDELLGYNVYRGEEFYRFQTSTSLYHLETGSNCEEDFLYFGEFNGFMAHITAVYADGLESEYLETIFVDGPLLGVGDVENQTVKLYPNPTNGVLYIGNENLTQIKIYDISGKKLKEWQPQTQIDLSDFAKGLYFIQLVSNTRTLVEKIVIE